MWDCYSPQLEGYCTWLRLKSTSMVRMIGKVIRPLTMPIDISWYPRLNMVNEKVWKVKNKTINQSNTVLVYIILSIIRCLFTKNPNQYFQTSQISRLESTISGSGRSLFLTVSSAGTQKAMLIAMIMNSRVTHTVNLWGRLNWAYVWSLRSEAQRWCSENEALLMNASHLWRIVRDVSNHKYRQSKLWCHHQTL